MPMKTIEGYSKEKYTDTSVLLAGGGAKALSDFIGSLTWDSTNKKIKYTPVGGSATDLVTLSWDNISGKPSSFTAASHTHNMNDIKWPGGHNLVTSATANGQEWSIDLTPGTYTGTYWHVWRATTSGVSVTGTLLKVDADTGKVSAPYGFVGNLEGNADYLSGKTFDVTVEGDANTYYPVQLPTTSRKSLINTISVWKNLGTPTAAYTGNHSSTGTGYPNGSSSCWYEFVGRSNSWDGNGGYYYTRRAWYGYARLCSHAEAPGSPCAYLIIWLRGGGTAYKVSVNFSTTDTPTVFYESKTYGSGSSAKTVAPRTDVGNEGKLTFTYIGNVTGSAASATTATTASKLGTADVGSASRPIYLAAGVPTQTTYKMAGTNVTATTALAISTNLDTGIWYVNGTNSTDLYSVADGVAYVNKYSDSWIAEIYQDYRTGQIALRGKNNGTWQAWRKVLDSSNFNTWAPKLDGTGATGTWGISVTGSAGSAAVASKISDITTSDAASSTDTWRRVWFSYNDNVTGRPAYSDNFAYQTSNDLLKVGGLLSSKSIGSDNFLTKVNGGISTGTTSSRTGAITITLPATIGNTMVSMWIDVYNYVTNTSFTVHVGGYAYNNNTWVNNSFATVYGADHKVRLGHNGTSFVIYIGETNSTWAYPQVIVRDVLLGYQPTVANWRKEITISWSTSFSNITWGEASGKTSHKAWTSKNLDPTTFAASSHNHSAADITSGTLAIARGGTGATTQADINKNFIAALSEGSSDFTDNTEIISSYASNNGFADTNAPNVPYKRDAIKMYNYIKGKLDSVYSATDHTHSNYVQFAIRAHDSSSAAYTGPTYISTYVGGKALIDRGSWAYANNGYVDTGDGVIPLAGTMVITINGGTSNKYGSAIFVTPSTASTPSGTTALKNEMWFFTQNGNNSSYPDAWTRVLTNRNYTSYTVKKDGTGATGTWGISVTGSAGSVAWDNVTGKPSSFTPASHSHTFAATTNKITNTNEFNFVDAEQATIWFNYRRASGSSATTATTQFVFAQGTTSAAYAKLKADGFIKNGSDSSHVLLGDGGHKAVSDFATSGHTHSGYAASDHTHNYAGSDSAGGPANTVKGAYTSNGGQQNPNYFGKNKVGFLMMNTTVNSNSQYKDWIIMDCYSGNDVGGGVAFGVNRQSLGAYIMRSASARTSWAESAELLGTHNYTTYCATKTHSHSEYALTGHTHTGYASSTHSHAFADITSKIVNSDEFNFVDAEKATIWINYRRASGSAATTATTQFSFAQGLANTSSYANIKAAGFIKNGSDSSHVLLGDGTDKAISDFAVDTTNFVTISGDQTITGAKTFNNTTTLTNSSTNRLWWVSSRTVNNAGIKHRLGNNICCIASFRRTSSSASYSCSGESYVEGFYFSSCSAVDSTGLVTLKFTVPNTAPYTSTTTIYNYYNQAVSGFPYYYQVLLFPYDNRPLSEAKPTKSGVLATEVGRSLSSTTLTIQIAFRRYTIDNYYATDDYIRPCVPGFFTVLIAITYNSCGSTLYADF